MHQLSAIGTSSPVPPMSVPVRAYRSTMSATINHLSLCVVFVLLFASTTHADYQFASPRVTSGLLSLYTFTEGAGNPTSTASTDQSGYGAPVLGNLTNINADTLSSSWTTGRAGLHLNGTGFGNRAVSTRNASTLVSLLSSSAAFTFELWFIPANASQYGIIAGLGSWAPRSVEPGYCRISSTTYDSLAISQQGLKVVANFLGGSAATPSCVTSVPVSLVGTGPHHFIIMTNATYLTTYIDGSISTVYKSNVNMSNWVGTMSLMFGQTISQTTPAIYPNITWAGDVLLAAIYSRTLSPDEMQQNHLAGVPHSVPLPYPSMQWVVVDVTAVYTTLPLMLYNNTDASTYANITLFISSQPAGALYVLSAGYPTTRVGDTNYPVPFAFNPSTRFAYLPIGTAGYIDSLQYYVSHSSELAPVPHCCRCSAYSHK